MIREIGVDLQAELKKRGVPFVVVDGPEPSKTTTWGRERIVIEYDQDATDKFTPPRSQSLNPKRRFNAVEACKFTVYAQSTSAGATVFEHRRRVKHARDAVVNAMALIASVRRNQFLPTTGKLITPPDLVDAERPGGAVYEQKFTYEHGVPDVTWAGMAEPEGTVGAVNNKTNVSDPTTGSGSPETACGA